MEQRIRLLAVSRMEAGFCIAGVPEGASRWVRPVRPNAPISARDLLDAGGRALSPLDLVTFELLRAKPQTPHVEDWIANFNRRPIIEQAPEGAERLAILEKLCEASPDAVLEKKSRSLILIEPDSLTASFEPAAGERNYGVRITFASGGASYEGESATPGFPCTDLKLRSWGRTLKTKVLLDDARLKNALGVERVFLTIGLTRLFNDKHWPMVVGVHTFPDYAAEIDFDSP